MSESAIQINLQVQRQFILGRQGLYPGRRWRGLEGVRQALLENCAVQIDPLNVTGRSHDIALFGRVLDYQPALLEAVLYQERLGFDWGGTVTVHPMQELPYWRVVMKRKSREPRRIKFAEEHTVTIQAVNAVVEANGPTGSRSLDGNKRFPGAYRSVKDTGQALYYLWLTGELMTHSRKGFERLYDLSSRIVPPEWDRTASDAEADDFLSRKVIAERGLRTLRSFRSALAGTAERPVSLDEAAGRLDAMLSNREIHPVRVEEDPKELHYALSTDLPALETLLQGKIPQSWQPVETTTNEEAVFLAPLEIVSARGRAQPLFGFDYIWEVYKPVEQRRWGYYTLPVLYQDRLVARLDPRLERDRQTLVVLGFWLEADIGLDECLERALRAGLRRFMHFLGATRLEWGSKISPEIRQGLSF